MQEKLYKIEQPNIKRITNHIFSERLSNILGTLSDEEFITLDQVIEKTNFPEYLHWKDIKYKNWIPDRFRNHKESFWELVKFERRGRNKTIICDEKGKFFTWKKLNHYEKLLHEITLDMSSYLLNFSNVSDADRKKYQLNGITEEAIASSQLEGAHTTRKIAKQMIKEKKEPKTFGEKMIFNNFATMNAIQEKYKDEKLSLDMLLDMHSMLTKDVMEKESEQGNFRTNEDKIVIQKGDDQSVVSYVTPSIEFVKNEIKKLIAFANDELEEKDFIHPVIKAIMLHFWIGLLHPFVDGNGRLARGLFYWYLLRKGYWAFALLPISLVIKKSPSQYADAYILSEQDDNDLTYFIDYNLRKINQAIENFRKYFSVKSKENSRKEEILHHYKNLNIRQIEALKNLSENPDKSLTLTTHKNIFGVTKMTAIKDLKGLLNDGFVISAKQGRNVFYTATEKLDEIQF